MCCSLLLTTNRSVGSRRLPASLTKTSTLFLLLFLGCVIFPLLLLAQQTRIPVSCCAVHGKLGTALPRGNALTTLVVNRAALSCWGSSSCRRAVCPPWPPSLREGRKWHLTANHEDFGTTTPALEVLQGHHQLSAPGEGASRSMASITISRGEVSALRSEFQASPPSGCF